MCTCVGGAVEYVMTPPHQPVANACSLCTPSMIHECSLAAQPVNLLATKRLMWLVLGMPNCISFCRAVKDKVPHLQL